MIDAYWLAAMFQTCFIQRRRRDLHTYPAGSFPSMMAATEGSAMVLIYSLLIVAMLFFFLLPITDARTARMKLSVVGSLGALLAVCAVAPRLIH